MQPTRTRVTIGLIALLVVAGAIAGFSQRSGDEASDGGGEVLGLTAGDIELASSGGSVPFDGDGEIAPESDIAIDDGAAFEESAAGEAPVAPQLQSTLDRKIVTTGSVDLEVEEVGRQFQEVARIASQAGGFVASSSFSNFEESQIADLTIRVPVESYQDVLNQIRGLGEVTVESSEANDVTEEYTDLGARLRTLEATESRYLTLLGEANDINEILQVQDRLDGVRGQIEQVQGRINLLDNLADLGTITVHLRPLGGAALAGGEDGGSPNPLEAAAASWDASLDAVLNVASGILIVAVFSWWIVPPLALFALGARWWVTKRERPALDATVS